MANNAFNPDLTHIRRSAKAVPDESWIKNFLTSAPAGVLGTTFEDQPFLSPKLFVFDEQRHALFFHSANEGRVWTNIHINPKVCFTTYEMGCITPAKRACSFGLEYRSVIVFGTLQVLQDQTEILRVLQLFMDKYAPHLKANSDYAPTIPDELANLAVYQLDIAGWSGKQDHRSMQIPGAFLYEDSSRKPDVNG